MHGKTSLALASMAVVAMFATPVQAAIVAQWLLDENPIALDSTVAADTTANHPGQYLDASFFATGAASSVTGHDGTPNSAVQFNKDAFVEVNVPPDDPNDLNSNGGLLARDPDGFMIELWFRMDENFAGGFYSENLDGSGGPTITFGFTALPKLDFTVISENFWHLEDMPAVDEPASGWNNEKWYYVAGVMDPIDEKKTWIYLADGAGLIDSDSRFRDEPYTNRFRGGGRYDDRVRLNGNYVTSGKAISVDDVTVYDQPFDPNSYLVQVLGIPEPTSLAILGISTLLLARRRQAGFLSGNR